MNEIKELIENIRNLSLLEIYDFWRKRKDVFLIKYDGEREDKNFTIIILSTEGKFESIRHDCDDIYVGLERAFLGYEKLSKEFNNSIDQEE